MASFKSKNTSAVYARARKEKSLRQHRPKSQGTTARVRASVKIKIVRAVPTPATITIQRLNEYEHCHAFERRNCPFKVSSLFSGYQAANGYATAQLFNELRSNVRSRQLIEVGGAL